MKNLSKDQKNIVNGYVNTNFINDITTVRATSDNNAYLIDQRLLDVLLRKVTAGSVSDIKEELHKTIDTYNTKEEIFSALDEYIYLDSIVQIVSPVVTEPSADETISMIAAGKVEY